MADVLIGSRTTNASGVAVFTNLAPGTYKFQEGTAPAGYTGDTVLHEFTIADGDAKTDTITNAPIQTGAITITKTDGYEPLAGATFSLKVGSKVMEDESVASDASGHVVFNNLMTMAVPVVYTVQEVKAPSDQFNADPLPHDISVSIGATVAQEIINERKTKGTMSVTLTDENYTQYGLEGTNVNLYRVEP